MKSALTSQEISSIPSIRISVIIPTYESADVLERCLRSLNRQSWPVDEVIVVDGFSRDNTREIASTLGAEVIVASGTQAEARNVGLANSKGNYVLFLDSDQQLDNSVVEDCVLACLMYGVEAVEIPEVFVGLNFWGVCSALWKNRMVKAWGRRGGIPRFYRRNTLLDSGAFNDKLRFWEDLELYQRLKLAGLREAWCRGRIIHYEADSLRNVIRKYVSYGQSIAEFRSNVAKAPYASTFRLTLSTIMQILRDPGESFSAFAGCFLLVILKSLSMVFGFLSRLRVVTV
jgi:glycosyltransferase involved in cell wall biosynthesis